MPVKTPICDFGQAAKSFELKSTNNQIIKLNDIKGENGTLVMFICNHCPYVIAVIKDIIEDCKNLELQYRGRIKELKDLKPVNSGKSDLYKAMKKISETNIGPQEQMPSMGCNIKWLNN